MADPTTDSDNDNDDDSKDSDESKEQPARPGFAGGGFFPYALPLHSPPPHMKKKKKKQPKY